MTPRLVIATGYPFNGKSSITHYMRDELGFCRVGSDDIGEMLYGKNSYKLEQDEQGLLKENIIWSSLDYVKFLLISRGFDTVIDTTAPENFMRKKWLDTKLYDEEFPAEKYLMVVRSPNGEELLRIGRPEIASVWDKGWEEPEKNPVDYEVLLYQNDTPQDRESIFADLRTRFGRKGQVWVPVTS